MRIEAVYKDGGRAYTYEVPDGLEVQLNDVVVVPPTFLGDSHATVVQLSSDYAGPCDRILGVRP